MARTNPFWSKYKLYVYYNYIERDYVLYVDLLNITERKFLQVHDIVISSC